VVAGLTSSRQRKITATIRTTTRAGAKTAITPIGTASTPAAAGCGTRAVSANTAQVAVPIAREAAASNPACRQGRERMTKASTPKALAIAMPTQNALSSNIGSPAAPVAIRIAPWLSPAPAPRIAPGPMMRRLAPEL
jgi:hypothetical protein